MLAPSTRIWATTMRTANTPARVPDAGERVLELDLGFAPAHAQQERASVIDRADRQHDDPRSCP